MLKLKWHTEQRKIKDLVPYEYNPRQMTDKQAKDLTKSLEKFDLAEIPAIDTDNTIIAGHMRMKIMLALGRGEEEIDVRIPNRKLTQEEFDEYNIRSNKNTGEWDFDMLANFDEEMLKETGFSSDELDKVFKGEDVEEEEVVDEPKSKEGEIYQLGEHRLMCGDSTKESDIERLMNGKKADMIYTDPPFNIGIKYNKYKDNRKKEEFEGFIEKLISNALLFSKENVAVYFWCDEAYIWMIQNIYRRLEIENKRVCLWIKENMNPVPQVGYNKVYEPCVLGWRGKPVVNTKIKFFSEILNKDVEMENYVDIWFERRDNRNEYEHPTQKPISLAQKPITINSQRGDIILDLCGGSGSTLLSADQIGRVCYTMEMDARYVDVIRKRYAKLKGKDDWLEATPKVE